jgi:uracil-DNA glycosylase
MASRLDRLLREVRACRRCVDDPCGRPLPHAPRPVLRADSDARILIAGQAPGTRVHASGVPFTDPSGVRLRAWLGLTEDEFYDPRQVAILPMGFCFPGLTPAGADLPPRRECAPLWRERVLALLPRIALILAIGQYAQRWHLGPPAAGESVATRVADWRRGLAASERPLRIALPHPSWRNNAWLKANPWFETELLPPLRREVRRLIER